MMKYFWLLALTLSSAGLLAESKKLEILEFRDIDPEKKQRLRKSYKVYLKKNFLKQANEELDKKLSNKKP